LAELEFVGESRAFGLAVGEIGVDEDEVAVFGSQDPTSRSNSATPRGLTDRGFSRV
jgi:hypothetical protein